MQPMEEHLTRRMERPGLVRFLPHISAARHLSLQVNVTLSCSMSHIMPMQGSRILQSTNHFSNP